VFTSVVTIPGNILKVGAIYGTVGMDVHNDRVVLKEDDAFRVDVVEEGGQVISGRHQRVGAIAPLLQWQTTPGAVDR